MNPNDAAIEQLCPTCGLCCNGVIFANVRLRPGDNASRLRSLGLPVRPPRALLRPPSVAQPCAAFDGCRCGVYNDRPQYCREFECFLLKSVKAGCFEPAAALLTIRAARSRVDKVRRLLNALGDTDEAHPLSARFRRTATRLKRRLVDKEKANTFAQLTLAFHDLNLLLGDAFYPGDSSQRPNSRSVRSAVVLICAGLLLFVLASRLRADQVEMRNGDRYAGQVLSLGTNTVVLQSDGLGTLRLPRVKVAAIKLGAFPATNSPALPPPTNGQSTAASSISPANGPPDLSPAFRQLGANTNLIQQVQKQFLSGAGPEANAKFNDLLGGYMSGRLSVDDIRAEARAAADQLRALQRESGEDAGFAAGAYLAILDHFLKETTPSTSATNTPGALPKTKPE